MSASITLPPTMFTEVQQLAEREGRTISEVLQEAVRRYLIQTRIRELQSYGRQQSENLGLAEADVERLIHDYRREQRERRAI
jgi:metal-responsive CopG/Arc/MetJ family transcriptional regulator